MKEYDVKITETLEKTVTVEAKSRADAEEQVRSAYYNSEYILDSENFTGVEFGTTEEREIQQEQAETMTVLLVKPTCIPSRFRSAAIWRICRKLSVATLKLFTLLMSLSHW